MKLKKKEFDRLIKIVYSVSYFDGIDEIKDILAKVGMRYENNPKTVQEKPLDFMEQLFNEHRKDVENDFIKQGASSYDPNIPFTRGLRDALEAVAGQKTERPLRFSHLGFKSYWNDFYSDLKEKVKELEKEPIGVSVTDPKIGDLGYFWDKDSDPHAIYGKISIILPGPVGGMRYGILFHREELVYYKNFSKTPPDLR
jgi:hypothetical protein